MLGFEGRDSEVLHRNGGYKLHGPLEISVWHTMGGGECGSLAYLEDHPRTSKCLGSPPAYKP